MFQKDYNRLMPSEDSDNASLNESDSNEPSRALPKQTSTRTRKNIRKKEASPSREGSEEEGGLKG